MFCDRLFAWMAEHPWSVGVLISATIVLVGLLENPKVM